MHLLKITPILKDHFAIVVSRPTTCFSETIFHMEPCSICQLLRVSASLPQKEAICSLWFRMAWLKKGSRGRDYTDLSFFAVCLGCPTQSLVNTTALWLHLSCKISKCPYDFKFMKINHPTFVNCRLESAIRNEAVLVFSVRLTTA